MATPRAVPALESTTTDKRQTVRNLDGVASATCPRCAVMFVCGANAQSCWCETLAVIDVKHRPEDLLGKGCLCEACLRAAISESTDRANSDPAHGTTAD